MIIIIIFLTAHALEDSPKVATPQKQGLTDTRVLKRDFSRKTNAWPSQRRLLAAPACVAFNTDEKTGE